MTTRFKNREEAGIILAEKLLQYKELEPVILALPRGGVPIAHEVAKKLHAPLDVVLVKKIGAPGHEEFAIGAVAEDEQPILNQSIIKQHNFNSEDVEEIIVDRISEIRKKAKIYRQKLPAISLAKRNVIIIDDGMATGATMISAIMWLRNQDTKKIIVAVPVSSHEAAEEIRRLSDEFICLITPPDFHAVGMWYSEFPQVSDEQVINFLLKQTATTKIAAQNVWIEDDEAILQGIITIPEDAKGIILFAHGGGSSHKSPRNLFVAKALNEAGFGTLLFDLLTVNEALNRKNIFDIDLMTRRLLVATEWAQKKFTGKPIAYFGASTGAAAALGAAKNKYNIFAIVSRGGRPDLALDSLDKVYAPTLLLVGSEDGQVISLNKLAKDHLINGKMIIIPKAGHLFEEEGTLEQVVEFAVNWFSNSFSLFNKKIDREFTIKEDVLNEIEENSIPFNNIDDLDYWINQISKNKIVMLGESTHGTKEFYNLRKEITKKLIQNHGYSFVAVEGDWPDCYNMNKLITGQNKNEVKEAFGENFHRWPTWMWANEEVPPMINWMKKNQLGGFYGLDVYSLYESLEEIKSHLNHIDQNTAAKIRAGYRCFESYDCNEIAYAKSLVKMPKGCQEEVVANLRAILRLRIQDTTFSPDDFFNTKQNARVIANAEKYYRAMIGGGAESWNVRDVHMMETLEDLLKHHGPNSKAIVWAHNTHIGDYHATDMLEHGYINLGGLAREKFGQENVFLLGLSTYEGQVTAGSAWGGVEKKMNLPKAKIGSYEEYFHQASLSMNAKQFLTVFKHLDKNSSLHRELAHRAVGVVYDPAHESRGNYVPTKMAQRYDGLIFVDKTTALNSLHSLFTTDEIPETWPQGI